MTIRANVLIAAKFGSCIALLAIAGCMAAPVPPPKEAPRVVVVADGGEPIKAAELDELTRAFADRYVGLLYSACDAARKDNPDPIQRREAQKLLVDAASNIYDIASNADAFTRLLDLVVVTRLMSQVWVDDGRADTIFAARAEPLKSAMNHGRAEVQLLAARVLTLEQVAVLDTLLEEWRTENPDMIHSSFVRFSNFAVGRGKSAASEVLAASGLFSEVGKAGQAVDEARLLGERMFFQLKREPTLLRWQAAAAKDDLLTSPELVAALSDVHRLTVQAEALPAHVAAEREAILASVDSRLARVDSTVAHVKELIDQTHSLVASFEPASKSIEQMVKSADVLFARYDAWDRWAVAMDPKPFEIREYTELVKESALTSQQMESLVKSSGNLLASRDWHARIDELNHAADGRIDVAAEKSKEFLDDLFRRIYTAIGVLFAMLVCYRLISSLLTRRLSSRPTPNPPPLG